jgi:hypothetical protein
MPTSTRIAITLATMVTATGCGGGDVPAKQMAETEAAIRASSEMGAESNPQASLHLKLAKDRYEQAQALSKDGEQEAASLALQKAEIDAELALALTRKEQANAKAEEAKRKLQPYQSAESAQSIQTVQPTQPTQATQPTKATPPTQATQPTQPTK